MAEARSLHAKLAEVMAEAERIPKNGTYSGQGGFKFVQAGDAADAIRKALGTRKVSMLPSSVEVIGESEHETRSGGTMTTLTVRTTWTLVDGESGETAIIQSLGTGADAGDKYSPKAQTNAMKYALLMGFLLSTGDDPELSDSSDRRNRPADRTAAVDGGLIGIAEKTDKRTGDFALRQTPDGSWLGFRLKEGRGGQLLEAHGEMADALAAIEASVIGKRIQVWGRFVKRDLSNGGSYQAFVLARISGPDFTLPSAGGEGTTPGNPEAAGAGQETAPAAPDELDQLAVFAGEAA